MKLFSNVLLPLLVLSFLLASCKVGMYSEAKGLPQKAYLQLIQTNTSYTDGVEVIVDGQPPFTAKVNKQSAMSIKGNVYSIPTGRHRIQISANGKLLYDREIFTSSQETKQIQLP